MGYVWNDDVLGGVAKDATFVSSACRKRRPYLKSNRGDLITMIGV